MLIYIIKSAACMAIFLLFYKLLLEKENMHVFKRFYLMLALIASLIIPGLVFIEYVEPVVTTYTSANSFIETSTSALIESPARDIDVVNWPLLAWTIYGIGALIFGIRFLRNLFQILNRIRRNTKVKQGFSIKVLLLEQLPPHTFFKYIFLNKEKFETNTIPKEVLLHEEIHAKQRHSFDVVFIELLQVILWFNPLLYFFKKSIKLNHEFLADSAVIAKNVSTSNYQNTLLSYLSQDSLHKYQSVSIAIGMANAINYSSIKKRFKVMKTRTSKKAILLRSILLLPLLTIMLYGFSETKTIQRTNPDVGKNIKKELDHVNQLQVNILNAEGASKKEVSEFNSLAEKYNAISIENRVIPLGDLKILESIYRKMSSEQKEKAQPFPECLPKNIQKGASREQMATYNALARKYNEMDSDNMRILMKDVEQLKYIYSIMSDKQKADAEPFPDFPEPPPAPNHPNIPNPPSPTKSIGVSNGGATTIPKPLSPTVMNGKASTIPTPPLPPEPIEPLDHIIAMAKEGAVFFFEGKEISSDKAIELFKKRQDLNISTTNSNSKRPQVRISKEPINIGAVTKKESELLKYARELEKKNAHFYLDNKHISSKKALSIIAKKIYNRVETFPYTSKTPEVRIYTKPLSQKKSSGTNLETGNIKVNGKELFYSTKNGTTSYFNKKGEQVDKKGRTLVREQEKSPTFYFNGEKITSVKAHELLKNNKSIQVTTEDYSEDEYAIVLTDLSKVSYHNYNKNTNPNSVIDLTEMIEKEALFFYNDQPISVEKALWLTQNEHIDRVNNVGSKSGKPKVYLWKKV
ncbi:M56 family metallopeptidase [Croceitalea marina]|uniref:M56 family metallopeptidase n=1 Tax=Croceitalea marina TaxID=1775166 RepID=A0ABW5MZA7_9FLAO